MATLLERITVIENHYALEDLNSAFCHCLDHDDIDNLVNLFCEDAVYSHGDRVSQGRDKIRSLFQQRRQAGIRTSRHLQTGLSLQLTGTDQETGTSVCLTFAADAGPPISPAAPYLVADFTDEYRRCPDGRWRIRKRHIERIFTAPGNAAPVGSTARTSP